jgi:hypothetical protein
LQEVVVQKLDYVLKVYVVHVQDFVVMEQHIVVMVVKQVLVLNVIKLQQGLL